MSSLLPNLSSPNSATMEQGCPHCCQYFYLADFVTHLSQCLYNPGNDFSSNTSEKNLSIQSIPDVSFAIHSTNPSPPPLDQFYAESCFSSNSQPHSRLENDDENHSFDSHSECTENYSFDSLSECTENYSLNDEPSNPISFSVDSPLENIIVPDIPTSNDPVLNNKGNLVRVISALYYDSFGSDSSSSEGDNLHENFVEYFNPTSDIEILEVTYPNQSPIAVSSPPNFSFSPNPDPLDYLSQHSISFGCISPYSVDESDPGEISNTRTDVSLEKNDTRISQIKKSLFTSQTELMETDLMEPFNELPDSPLCVDFEDFDAKSDDFPIRSPSPEICIDITQEDFDEISAGSFRSDVELNPLALTVQEQTASYLKSLSNFLLGNNVPIGSPATLNNNKIDLHTSTSQKEPANTTLPIYEDVSPIDTPQRHKKCPEYCEVSPRRTVLNML